LFASKGFFIFSLALIRLPFKRQILFLSLSLYFTNRRKKNLLGCTTILDVGIRLYEKFKRITNSTMMVTDCQVDELVNSHTKLCHTRRKVYDRKREKREKIVFAYFGYY
jgi:hypothetical protein